jgi:hypothetical protein
LRQGIEESVDRGAFVADGEEREHRETICIFTGLLNPASAAGR